MNGAALVVGQTVLLVALAPMLDGAIAAWRARLEMRRGAPVWQRYLDLARLFHKESVLADDASWLARAVPYLMLAAALTAAAWTPVALAGNALGFAGDLVMTVALLSVMRVLLALAALDPGSAHGGVAAGRHLALSALAEPALLLAGFTLAMAAGTTELSRISRAVVLAPPGRLAPAHLLAAVAAWLVVVAETGRGPVGDAGPHAEPAAVHEDQVLDYSGRHLALVQWAGAIRQALLLTLLANLFLPWGVALVPRIGPLAAGALAWAAKLAAFTLGIALTESVVARMRPARVPRLAGTAFLLSLLALTSVSLLGG